MIRSINKIRELFLDGNSREVISEVENFFNKYPYYKEIDYFSFSNALEKSIYERYFHSLENSIVLQEEFNLGLVYLSYGVSLLKMGEFEEGKKYLDIAYQVNPVSPSILFYLLKFYNYKEDYSKVNEFSKKIFKFTYDSYVLINTYPILANYFMAEGDYELFENIIHFFEFLKFGKENNSLKDVLLSLEMNEIPIGFNPELIDISRNLCKSSLEKIKENSKGNLLEIDFVLKEDNVNIPEKDDYSMEDDVEKNGFDEDGENLIFNHDAPIVLNNDEEEENLRLSEKYLSLLNYDFKFFNAVFRDLIGLNSYLKGLSLGSDVKGIIREARISMANKDYDEAILKIEKFLNRHDLEKTGNCFFFNNEIERTLYYYSSNFDKDFALLDINKSYSYLYYLYGFSFYSKEKYEDAKKYYLKALDINPFSCNLHLSLIELDLRQYKGIDINLLRSAQKLAYSQHHISRILSAFSKYLLILHRRDDSEIIDNFARQLELEMDFTSIISMNFDLRIISLLNEFNLNVKYDEIIVNHIIEILNNYNFINNRNLIHYQKFYKEIMEYNNFISDYIPNEIELKEKPRFLKDFDEMDLVNSFILVKDNFDERYYKNILSLKLEFDEEKFDSSDSFIVYGYKQVNGSVVFIFITTSDMVGEEVDIHSRGHIIHHVLLTKKSLENNEIILLDDVQQFKPYIKTSKDYSKWLSFNLSGDKEKDIEFLLNQLETVDDDIFASKKKSIHYKLYYLVDYKELLNQDIPCLKTIHQAELLLKEENFAMALAVIDEFLKEYPFLYISGFGREFHYFNNDFEQDLFHKYVDYTKQLILLPKAHDYCRIFKLKSICLFNLGDNDNAILLAEDCLKLNPFDIDAKIILADIYLEKKFYHVSISYLKNALLFNSDLNRHIKIYKKMAKAYCLDSKPILCEYLNEFSNILSILIMNGEEKLDYAFLNCTEFRSIVLKIRDLIVDEGILLGFNPTFVEYDDFISEINKNVFLGTEIDILIQEIKPFLNNYSRMADPKIKEFINKLSDSAIYGYRFPKDFQPFIINLSGPNIAPTDIKENEKYFNFRNEFEFKLYNSLSDEKALESFLIPYDQKYVDLLLLYADSLKHMSQDGIRGQVLKEVLKLNPLDCRAFLGLMDISYKFNRFDEFKKYLDICFEIVYDKGMLIELYQRLSLFYRCKNFKDLSDIIDDFIKKLEKNSFKDDDLIKFKQIFEQHHIQFGFNQNLMSLISSIDEDVFEEMYDFNYFLDSEKWGW